MSLAVLRKDLVFGKVSAVSLLSRRIKYQIHECKRERPTGTAPINKRLREFTRLFPKIGSLRLLVSRESWKTNKEVNFHTNFPVVRNQKGNDLQWKAFYS